MRINTTTSSVDRVLTVPKGIRLPNSHRQLFEGLPRVSRQRRRLQVGLIALNISIIIGVIIFVILARSGSSGVSAISVDGSGSVNPLDQVSSADIALTIARMTSMPEATAAANQAETQAANVAIAETSNNAITKPQIVTTAQKSVANIQFYTTVSGDTLQTLASKFGVTSNSIAWSNNLSSPILNPGMKLRIPPVDGIIYTVQAGDTPASLAAKFQSNETAIISFNNAQLSGLTPGEQIVIPNGIIQTATSSINNGFPWGGSSPVYGYNGYDYGYCTWYVANQIPVPSNWGNASTWAYYASQSGWNVSTTPNVGSVAQTADAAGGQGHVAIVKAVNGSQIEISEMNGPAGWGNVDTRWVPASAFQHFISE